MKRPKYLSSVEIVRGTPVKTKIGNTVSDELQKPCEKNVPHYIQSHCNSPMVGLKRLGAYSPEGENNTSNGLKVRYYLHVGLMSVGLCSTHIFL